MVQNLQKTATAFQRIDAQHRGVLHPGDYTHAVRLECYEPSPNLAPFVVHYYVGRLRPEHEGPYIATDVLTQPVVTILIASDTAIVSGPVSGMRTLHLSEGGVYAGIKFRPGGFRAFWNGTMSDLADKGKSVHAIFPDTSAEQLQELITHDDDTILRGMESILRAKNPQFDPAIEQVNRIMELIASHDELQTTQAVAEAANINERTLQHLFNTYVGVGVKWVIMRSRLLDAIQHAHFPEGVNWTTIAADLGYSTQSHFVNDFKKIIGTSPTSYAKRLLGD